MDLLNHLTNAYTGFPEYSALVAACQAGYVPTIYGRNRRERRLIRFLRADGLPVRGKGGRNW